MLDGVLSRQRSELMSLRADWNRKLRERFPEIQREIDKTETLLATASLYRARTALLGTWLLERKLHGLERLNCGVIYDRYRDYVPFASEMEVQNMCPSVVGLANAWQEPLGEVLARYLKGWVGGLEAIELEELPPDAVIGLKLLP